MLFWPLLTLVPSTLTFLKQKELMLFAGTTRTTMSRTNSVKEIFENNKRELIVLNFLFGPAQVAFTTKTIIYVFIRSLIHSSLYDSNMFIFRKNAFLSTLSNLFSSLLGWRVKTQNKNKTTKELSPMQAIYLRQLQSQAVTSMIFSYLNRGCSKNAIYHVISFSSSSSTGSVWPNSLLVYLVGALHASIFETCITLDSFFGFSKTKKVSKVIQLYVCLFVFFLLFRSNLILGESL